MVFNSEFMAWWSMPLIPAFRIKKKIILQRLSESILRHAMNYFLVWFLLCFTVTVTLSLLSVPQGTALTPVPTVLICEIGMSEAVAGVG